LHVGHLVPESVHIDSTPRGGPVAAVPVDGVAARVHGSHLVAVGIIVVLSGIGIGGSALVPAPCITSAATTPISTV